MRSRLACLLILPPAFGLAIWLRYGLVEPTAVALACDGGEESLRCLLRAVTIQLFAQKALGALALLLAGWQFWRPRAWRMTAALAVSALGLILYNPLMAATAVTLLGLSVARWPASAAATRRGAPAGR